MPLTRLVPGSGVPGSGAPVSGHEKIMPPETEMYSIVEIAVTDTLGSR